MASKLKNVDLNVEKNWSKEVKALLDQDVYQTHTEFIESSEI